jgi:hypothetical protein
VFTTAEEDDVVVGVFENVPPSYIQVKNYP